MNRKKSYGISVGTSSILVIIVILSLVCFAGLSIVSANADYQLSKKLAERTTSYYQATSKAHEQLAKINASLKTIYSGSTDQTDYENKIKESLTDSLTFSYAISDSQSLVVAIKPIYHTNEGNRLFTIEQFQIVTIEEPEIDTSLPVLLHD